MLGNAIFLGVCVERGVGMVVVVVAHVECMHAYVRHGMSCVCCMYHESAYACIYGGGRKGGGGHSGVSHVYVMHMYVEGRCGGGG